MRSDRLQLLENIDTFARHLYRKDTIMATLTAIRSKQKGIERTRKELREEELSALRRTVFRCVACKQRSHIRFWTFVQVTYYVSPYSCTGGAYWQSCRTDTCDIQCPKCQADNYIYNHPQKEKLITFLNDSAKRGFEKNILFKDVIVRQRHE